MGSKFVSESGRCFTDYRPSCSINRELQKKFNKMDPYEYRLYLQRNGGDILRTFRTNALKADCQSVCDCKACLKNMSL